jgi:hypothetical protein
MDNLRSAKALGQDFTCPLTDRPCSAGSPAECSHFWQCVYDALAKRLGEIKGRPHDDCPARRAGLCPPPDKA